MSAGSRALALLLAFSFCAAARGAQKPADAKVVALHWAPGVYNIGSLIPFELQVPLPSKEFYLEGEFAEQTDWGSGRISKINQSLPSSFPGTLTLKGSVQIFATGTAALPARTMIVHTSSGVQAYSIKADLIRITPLLSGDNAPRPPIAAPMALPKPFPWDWLLGGLAAAALLVLGFYLLVRRLRSRRGLPRYVPEVKENDPDRWIREEVDRLFKAQIEPPLRYQRLSHALREYLEIRFRRPFLEWTTSEIRSSLGAAAELRDVPLTDFLNLLGLCDYVMFARYRPLPTEEKDAYEIVIEFLDHLARPAALEEAS